MFFKQKSNIIFRSYESFGYITDNRNFGYKLINSNENYIGDKILSESGNVFFSVLDRKPQNINELSNKINKQFPDVDIQTIKSDASEFYCMLEQDGFVVSGKTFEECEEKDTQFSYKMLDDETINEDSLSISKYSEKDTQDFFEEYFNGKPQLTNLHIELTSKCNERCLHCYIPHENKISSISPNLFYAILEQCKDLKLLHLTLSGGEPMLHKEFCDFLKKCREYNFSVNVLSNLTLLNDRIIEEMKANPLLGVQVSLYSMTPAIHDEITQMKGSFEKTKNAILKLIENDIPLQISCPIMKQNKSTYNDVIEWANKQKVHVGTDYNLIAEYDHTTQNLNCRLPINEIRGIIYDKVATDTKYLEQMQMAAKEKKDATSNDFVCSVCRFSICITENGDVYPCAGWQDYIVGNVKNTLLKDIWENSEKVQYLRGLRNKDFPKCIQCIDREYCTMCMVRNSNENSYGDPLIVSQHFCNIAKLNKQIVLDLEKLERSN
ncbi:radical SAM protein [Dysgonomonas mossii]|uniref:Radical SAM protein n=2 Tax=Dysgonomonas TaxID=156973 RepID=A0A4Y9IR96_9BACT|nr:radical SAM protein [Dysgonomonas mossii]MBF0760157.1 radical SAM protein [Dysgonomonas mossii]TFU91107.1 radical SAM protein [Dysgonomonas mossii]SBV90461.1 Radical SAM domain protein [uncultured Dysgonomonas sp.]